MAKYSERAGEVNNNFMKKSGELKTGTEQKCQQKVSDSHQQLKYVKKVTGSSSRATGKKLLAAGKRTTRSYGIPFQKHCNMKILLKKCRHSKQIKLLDLKDVYPKPIV